MMNRSETLVRVADAYERLLFEGELCRRLSHHMALVASERCLAIEFAMLINERAAELGLRDWSAIVEKGVVDVSLIPPAVDPRQQTLPSEGIFLEFKLISPEYWSPNWKEVRADLDVRFVIQPPASTALDKPRGLWDLVDVVTQ